MIDKYKEFKENIREDDYSYLNDDLNDDSESFDGVEDVIEVFYEFFDRSGISINEIDGDSYQKHGELYVYINLEEKEEFNYISRIFETLNRFGEEIIPQFKSEIDLWVNKSGEPLLTIIYSLDEF